MVEVLNVNFERQFDGIVNAIQKATFIALDAEFTGLDVDDNNKKSLFDSPKQRYEKLRKSAASFMICQLGVSAFIKDKQFNTYHAQTYNFYLSPHPRGMQDFIFSWQASCIEFLCQYKFDFNKFAYNGVPCMRLDQEVDLRNRLENKTLFGSIERGAKEGDNMILKVEECISSYMIHKEIRSRYPELWTSPADKMIVVQKVSTSERHELELKDNSLDNRLIEQLLGFTRIIRTIINEKKPLIGHNLLMDILLMYNQFYKILPKSYEEFKNEINQLFPKIYDTKHMAYCMRKDYEEFGIVQSSVLKDLYKSLDSHHGRFHVLFSPEICHAEGFDKYATSTPYHEAGFDAYMAGYVFLRLAHMLALHDKPAEKHQPLPFEKLLEVMEPFVNRLNLIRANHFFLNLQGTESPVSRPKWLVIESTTKADINLTEIVDMCSQHGSVDVKLLNRHRALIATMNYVTVREILKACKNKQEITVTVYNAFAHSNRLRSCLW